MRNEIGYRTLVILGRLVALGACAAVPTYAQAALNLSSIADTTSAAPAGTFASFISTPAIGGDSVAFHGSFGPGGFSSGIFTGNGELPTSIARNGDATPIGGVFNVFRSPAASGSTIAFHATHTADGGGGAIFAGRGAPVSNIVKTGDAAPTSTFTLLLDPSISGSRVAFRGYYNGNAAEGIFSGDGGPLTTIRKSGDAAPSGSFTNFGNPAISGGTVAFRANYTGGNNGIFASDGGALTTIAKSGDSAPSGAFTAFADPAISGSTVAFLGNYTGGSGIFTGSGGAVTAVAKTGDVAPLGTFLSFGAVSLSDGVAVFRGDYSGGSGIFLCDGGPLSTVVKTGDALFGSIVTNVNLGRFGYDGAGGKTAFYYELQDGRRGIAVAGVPEARAWVMLGLVAISVGITAAVRSRVAKSYSNSSRQPCA